MRDRRLVHRLSRADPDALRQIYHRYKDDLLTVAMALLGDPDAAQDCVHDVFVHFVGDPADLRANRNLRGYLMRCVANRAKNLIRRRQLQCARPMDEQNYAGEQDCPGCRLTVSEESMRIFEAMAKLPAEQREVVSLHVHGQMKFREIAEQLDVSINTVQSRYRYGIEKLRTLL
ncbi:MAG: RNA polymerase sigma factor [Phycisphaerales bacterium]|nr:MAG: RNA polymerase sigma factor [Phycisphaerales bacterium]